MDGMQILYAIAIAAVIGIVLHFVIPGRHAYGIGLAPAVSAAVAAAAWAGLAWIGWDWTNGATWLISIGLGTVAALLVALLAPVARKQSDTAFFERAKRA